MAFGKGNEYLTNDPKKLALAVERHKNIGGLIVLEPAFGGRFAVDLPNGAISIGLDPGDYPMDSSDLRSGRGCERIFFTDSTSALPSGFAADAVVIVAPAPSDIEGMLSDLEVIMKKDKTQFLIVFEEESYEAENGETAWAVGQAVRWLGQRGLVVEVDDEFGDDPDFDSDGEFSEYLKAIGLPGGVLKSRNFGRESRWTMVCGTWN